MTFVAYSRQAEAWNGSVGVHRAAHQSRYDASWRGRSRCSPGSSRRCPGPEQAAAQTAIASLSDPDRTGEVLARYERVTAAPAAPAAPVGVESVRGRHVHDAVEFLLSRVPGGALPASRLAGPEEALRPFTTDTGVRTRAGVWFVTAVRLRHRVATHRVRPSAARGLM